MYWLVDIVSFNFIVYLEISLSKSNLWHEKECDLSHFRFERQVLVRYLQHKYNSGQKMPFRIAW